MLERGDIQKWKTYAPKQRLGGRGLRTGRMIAMVDAERWALCDDSGIVGAGFSGGFMAFGWMAVSGLELRLILAAFIKPLAV